MCDNESANITNQQQETKDFKTLPGIVVQSHKTSDQGVCHDSPAFIAAR